MRRVLSTFENEMLALEHSAKLSICSFSCSFKNALFNVVYSIFRCLGMWFLGRNNNVIHKPQGLEEILRDPHCEKAKKISTIWGSNSFGPSFDIFRFESMMGEVFLQAEELLFCLLFFCSKKVRSYFWGIFSPPRRRKNNEKPVHDLLFQKWIH